MDHYNIMMEYIEKQNPNWAIDKKPLYDKMVANNEIEIKPFAEIVKTLQNMPRY